MFADLRDAPPDPILGMAQLFAADPDPRKVDLGIGVYKDDKGDVIVLDTVKNLGILIGLVLVGGLSVAASSLTSGVLGAVLTAVGIATLNSVVTVLIGVILSLLTGWLLFVYLYTVLPTERRPFREVAQGAVFGGLGLAILQYFAGLLCN